MIYLRSIWSFPGDLSPVTQCILIILKPNYDIFNLEPTTKIKNYLQNQLATSQKRDMEFAVRDTWAACCSCGPCSLSYTLTAKDDSKYVHHCATLSLKNHKYNTQYVTI